MEVSEFFLKFLIILITAKTFAELFAWLRLPSVLGEVVAGILIGPSLLGMVQPDATFSLLAEIGVLLLLFEVGMETDVGQLMKVGGQASLVAITGVFVPALLGFWVSTYVLRLPADVSLFIGGTLVATSIGITVRVFGDIGKQRTKTAKIVLGAAVLDDVAGVLILALLYDFTMKGEVRMLHTVSMLGIITLFLFAAPVIAKLLSPLIAKLSTAGKTKGMIPTLIVSLILALAVVSHGIGAPEILGSFIAGIALSGRFFLPFGPAAEQSSHHLSEKVGGEMKPIIDLFVPVFFVMVGASINFSVIDLSSPLFWKIAGMLFTAAVLGKLVSGIWVKGSLRKKISTGVAMVPRGEVGLIFAEVGRRSGIFDDTLYAVTVFVVALTTLFAPVFLRMIMKGEE
jgi:Kef-type K+ transport system membrane component KefB